MLEPLQGEGGIIPGNADYFAATRKLCDETGALVIRGEEAQVGMKNVGQFHWVMLTLYRELLTL